MDYYASWYIPKEYSDLDDKILCIIETFLKHMWDTYHKTNDVLYSISAVLKAYVVDGYTVLIFDGKKYNESKYMDILKRFKKILECT